MKNVKILYNLRVPLLGLTIIMLFCSKLVFGSETLNKSEKESLKEVTHALDVYSEILIKEEFLNEEEDTSGEQFALSDLDGDGVPELLLARQGDIRFLDALYSCRNGQIVEIESLDAEEFYFGSGSLVEMPERGTYGYYRGGPARNEDDIAIMPYQLMEYQILDDQVHLKHWIIWEEDFFTSEVIENSCYLDEKTCSIHEIEAVRDAIGPMVEFLCNSKHNRELCGILMGNTSGKNA